MATRSIVIVGSCIGGVRTAQSLRQEGFDGRIVLVGAESELPYDRPPLSKQFLAGQWEVDRCSLLTADEAAQARIELRLGVPAVQLDLAVHEVVLADDRRIAFDTLVIATGASARPSPWQSASGVHVIRDLAHSRGLQQALTAPGPLVVVGGGFIGAEVAATAQAAGREVTVVDPLPAPMARVLGDEVGGVVAGVHARHGVRACFAVGVADITGEDGDLVVTLTDGRALSAVTVVVGIGATPNVEWLASSGLQLDDGVLCDEQLRAVGAADVYAVGDVARWPVDGASIRLEHWTSAVEQAATAAYNIVHSDEPRAHRPTHYVWSDQYDWKLQVIGRPGAATGHVVVGDTESDPPRFVALYQGCDGELVGAATVNWPKALLLCRRRIGVPMELVRDQVHALPARPLGARPATDDAVAAGEGRPG